MSPPQPTSAPADLEEVVDQIRTHTRPLDPEPVPLSNALHRVLREAVTAPEDAPPFDRSAMDGYAIRTDDIGLHFRAVDEIRAGDWKPRSLSVGEAVRVATGAALPGPNLRVVPKENVELTSNSLRLLRTDESHHVRHRGEDARQGQILVETGTRLHPGALALLASIGQTLPLVSRLPRVLHLATGNEIIPPHHTPLPGQIRDSNSTLVRAYLEQQGIAPSQTRVREDFETTATAIRDGMTAPTPPDLILISGGASVGDHDFTLSLLERLDWHIHISGTRLRPGKPLIFATHRTQLAFGLPGNPLAHFVSLHLFVQTALERLLALPDRDPFLAGTLSQALASDGSPRETLWPARCRPSSNQFDLTPLRWTNSGDLTSLAQANALLRIPARTRHLAAGTHIPFAPCTPTL
jgi:molybdopterin molybdotransferase